MRRSGHRSAVLFVAVLGALLTIILAPPVHAAPAMRMTMDGPAVMRGTAPSPAGMSLRRRFDYLSRQQTNSCMLQTSQFASMNPSARLQGACCGPMDYQEYSKQIPAIAEFNRDHHTANVIPSDPYDMSVAFVRKLNSFNDTILLTNAQLDVYDEAWKYAPDRAPCCCHCYRWTAFEGQAKYLIAVRRFGPREIGEIWGLDDGCGNTEAGGGMSGMGMG